MWFTYLLVKNKLEEKKIMDIDRSIKGETEMVFKSILDSPIPSISTLCEIKLNSEIINNTVNKYEDEIKNGVDEARDEEIQNNQRVDQKMSFSAFISTDFIHAIEYILNRINSESSKEISSAKS